MAIESDNDLIADRVVGFLMAGVVGGLGYLLLESQRRAASRSEKRLCVLENRADQIARTLRETRMVITNNMPELHARRGAPVTSIVLERVLRGDGKLRRLVSQL